MSKEELYNLCLGGVTMAILPIYVSYDSHLLTTEKRAIITAANEFNELFRDRRIYIFGSGPWSDNVEYSSGDWYVDKAKKILRKNSLIQLDANSLIRLLAQEPWQKEEKHIDMFFTSYDLTAWSGGMRLNFCFGLTSGRLTVLSVRRFRELQFRDRVLAIKALFWHELGHILGAARDLNREATEDNLGPHCTSFGCIMRQGLSLEEWMSHAKQAERRSSFYCPSCMEDIARSTI